MGNEILMLVWIYFKFVCFNYYMYFIVKEILLLYKLFLLYFIICRYEVIVFGYVEFIVEYRGKFFYCEFEEKFLKFMK